MSIPCPSCGCATPEGTLCASDTAALRTMLDAVPQLVDQLDVAVAKQAKVASGGKAGKGSAHERSPVNWNAVAVRDALIREAAIWGDDIAEIRRSPWADRAVAGIGRAIKNAYRAIDRMQERQYLGVCLFEEDGLTCHAEIWARPGANQVTCTQCEVTHEVRERRVWLLEQAKDMLFTPKEAATMMGDVGGIRVTEASIRGYLNRGKRLQFRPGTNTIRLGDLLAVVLDDSERRSA